MKRGGKRGSGKGERRGREEGGGGEEGKGGGGEEGKGGRGEGGKGGRGEGGRAEGGKGGRGKGGRGERGKGGRGEGGRGEGESWFYVLHCMAIRVSFCSALLTNEIRFLVSDTEVRIYHQHATNARISYCLQNAFRTKVSSRFSEKLLDFLLNEISLVM